MKKDNLIMKEELYGSSKWFRQNAYTKLEMKIQPLVTLFGAVILTYLHAHHLWRYLHIFAYPASFVIMVIVMIFMKYMVYVCIGIIYDMEPMTP